jgi:hypothetical protein
VPAPSSFSAIPSRVSPCFRFRPVPSLTPLLLDAPIPDPDPGVLELDDDKEGAGCLGFAASFTSYLERERVRE